VEHPQLALLNIGIKFAKLIESGKKMQHFGQKLAANLIASHFRKV
jgi:hypothetical protein